MIDTADYVYDNNTLGGSTLGADGNLTQIIRHAGGSAPDRVTEQYYDWRDRLVATKASAQSSESTSVHRPIVYKTYDNLNEVTEVQSYDGDGVSITFTSGVPNAPSASLLRAQTITSYDDQGRVYKTQEYSVDPSTGTVSTNALTTNTWYDHRGDVIKTSNPGGEVDKSAYDGAGRVTTSYVSDGGGDSTWTDATNVTGDNVLSQAETTYDKDGNVILVTDRERNHDETTTGALGNPTTAPKARVSYTASYYDLANRLTGSVDVGTNGGTAWTRPSSVPTASDTVLVTLTGYNAAGWVNSVTDPRAIVEQKSYDNLGELTQTIEDYTNGTPTTTSNKTTNYTFDGDGHMLTLQAVETGGASETTKWIYGITTAGGSDINSNGVLATVQYPDPSTGSPSSTYQESCTVNALGQNKTYTDKAGNVHTYTLDVLGRVTSDAITTLATGFDNAVLRIDTAYDTQGNQYLVSSYSAATGGTLVNQVQRAYNGLGQMSQEWQSHSGAVNTSTTPSVQYGYTLMGSGANNSRLTSITYPNGKVLTYGYGTSGGLNDTISRLDNLSDSSGTVEQYSYLGLDTVIQRAHPQTNVEVTYISQTGSTGDAGDKYIGLDRFCRVVDQNWYNTSTSTSTDRFQYGYDRDSNALFRNNLVNTNFGELYHASGAGNGYDNLNQVSGFLRGVLTASGGSGTPLDTISSPSHTQTFTPDAVGNFSSITTDGTAVNRTHNQQNEVTGVGANTLAFDKNGNMTTDEQGRTLVYDAWNRLVAVKSGGTTLASYKFDGTGRRIVEAAGANTRDLYFDGWNVLEERLNGASTADMQYVWNPLETNSLVLRDRSTAHNGTLDERLWVQQNANGDVTALVNGSGSVVERYVYDPYGVVTYLTSTWGTLSGSAYAANYLFQGERLDPMVNQYITWNRVYLPTLQRWANPDPSGYKAGDNNLYRAEGDGPISSRDPSGLRVTQDGGEAFAYNPSNGSPEINWWFTSPWQTVQDIGNWGGDHPAQRVVDDDIRERALFQRDVMNNNIWPEGQSKLDQYHIIFLDMAKEKLPFHVDYGGNDGWTQRSIWQAKKMVDIFGPDGEFWQAIVIIGSAFGGGIPGLGPNKSCFPKGTPIHTSVGLKPIEEIVAGHIVMSFDHKQVRWAERPVVEVYELLHQGIMATIEVKGETIRATGGHPFWVVRGEGLAERPSPVRIAAYERDGRQEGRWVLARNLRAGDEVLLRKGEVVALRSVQLDEVEERVYNFHVAELQNYAVGNGGVLVHNTNDPGPRSTLPRASNGDYLPHPDATGPHTVIGTRLRPTGPEPPYTQGATFDGNGKFQGRTDVTDHGRGDHTNPHFHPATSPNSVGPGKAIAP
jgi:RHS repeat-associated protein